MATVASESKKIQGHVVDVQSSAIGDHNRQVENSNGLMIRELMEDMQGLQELSVWRDMSFGAVGERIEPSDSPGQWKVCCCTALRNVLFRSDKCPFSCCDGLSVVRHR